MRAQRRSVTALRVGGTCGLLAVVAAVTAAPSARPSPPDAAGAVTPPNAATNEDPTEE